MSTLRVSNIEAKADPSSPTVNEKVKITNSNGDVMLQLDGATSGITTVGINTTATAFTVDSAQNIEFVGIVTAASLSGNLTGDVTGNVTGNVTGDVTGKVVGSSEINVTGVVTATSFSGDITGNVTGNLTGDVNAGLVTATTSITVGDSFVKPTSIGIGTTTTDGRIAGLGTAIGTIVFNTTADSGVGQLEVYTSIGWVGLATEGAHFPVSATGGQLDTSTRSGYNVHIFTGSSEPFNLTSTGSASTLDVEYLIVGAGGGCAPHNPGGAGAGALKYGTASLSAGDYPISVGGGGGNPGGSQGATGGSSTFNSITSPGGGGGGKQGTGGAPGGSGGAGGQDSGGGRGTGTGDSGGTNNSTSPSNGWGNDGGSAPSSSGFSGGGGGGGAAAAGGWGSPGGTAGSGGNGLSYSITGISSYYAGGGGGRAEGGGAAGSGGLGGGGNANQNGTANTGGGAGAYASGGSGIIVIAYPNA